MLEAKCKNICAWHVVELPNLDLKSSNKGWSKKNLHLAYFRCVDDQPNIKDFFCVWPFMDPSSNLFRYSMRGLRNFFCSSSHGTFELCARGLHKRPGTKFPCSVSNFRHRKLEAEQSNFLQVLLKIRAPKLGTFKCVRISLIMFSECNFWFLYNLIPLISLFCKAFSILGLHLHRYFKLFLFHIMFSCIFFFFSINFFLHGPPSLEGAEGWKHTTVVKDCCHKYYFLKLHVFKLLPS
jgi:hypothetical protein